MAVELLDPAVMKNCDWPPGSDAVRAFATAVCRHGSEKLVSNIRTRMMVLRDGGVALPVTINDTEYENSYVCSTLTYVRYMKEELSLIGSPFLRRLLARVLDGAGAIIQRARLNKIVQVNNWLVSTNPYPINWSASLASITSALVAAFPEHLICFRSLNEWENQNLLELLKKMGYRLAACRQIYVYDRLPETYAVRHNAKKDHRLLRRTAYRVVQNSEFEKADYPRMAELFLMLYRQKHSTLNPAFTSEYMHLCHTSGMMRFLGLRSPSGRLDGMAGILTVGQAVPLVAFVGYDISLDRRIGLYRMLVALAFDTAMAEGWNVNLSSGAADFKRNRGGQPIIEYSAFYARHLSRARQFAVSSLTGPANIIGAPLMKWFEV